MTDDKGFVPPEEMEALLKEEALKPTLTPMNQESEKPTIVYRIKDMLKELFS